MRRRLFLGGLAAAPLAGVAPRARADDGISIIVPDLPTGEAGAALRALRPFLEDALASPVFVDFRPGAGGILGLVDGARAAADGRILTVLTPALTLAPWLSDRMDCAPADFAALGQISFAPSLLLVGPQAPWPTLATLLAEAQAGRELHVAAPWNWQPAALAEALFLKDSGLKHVQIAGARTPGEQLALLANGQLDLAFATLPLRRLRHAAPSLRVLAVAGPARLPDLPAVPTLSEAGIAVSLGNWRMLGVPAATTSAVQAQLAAALRHVMAGIPACAAMRDAGAAPCWLDGPAADQRMQSEYRAAESLFSELGLNIRAQAQG